MNLFGYRGVREGSYKSFRNVRRLGLRATTPLPRSLRLRVNQVIGPGRPAEQQIGCLTQPEPTDRGVKIFAYPTDFRSVDRGQESREIACKKTVIDILLRTWVPCRDFGFPSGLLLLRQRILSAQLLRSRS